MAMIALRNDSIAQNKFGNETIAQCWHCQLQTALSGLIPPPALAA
jgi:hypothetical protein